MRNIIILSALNIWSIDKNKGAQSFSKTVEIYINKGWNVTLINMSDNNESSFFEQKINHIRFKTISKLLISSKFTSFFGKYIYAAELKIKFYKLAKKELKKMNNEAIIYAYEIHSVLAAKKLSQANNIPLVTRFQGTKLTNIAPTFLNKIRKFPKFEAMSTTSDLIIMTDDGTQGDRVLKTINKSNTKVLFLKNGVDDSFFLIENIKCRKKIRMELEISDDDIMLLTVSRLVKWKRVDRSLSILEQLIRLNKNFNLFIIGEGEERAALEKIVADKELQNHVRFIGGIEHDEVKKYLTSADIFLSFYDISNLGNPLLEAMLQKKLIVTLNVGDTNKLISHFENGLIYNQSDLGNAIKDINEISNDKNIIDDLGSSARTLALSIIKTWNERMELEESHVRQIYDSYFLNY